MQVHAEREAAAAEATIHEASIAERLASDERLENESYAVLLKGNQDRIAALDKGSKDLANQLKAAQDKTEEITLQHQNNLAALANKAAVEQYKKDLTDLEQSLREQVNATEQGSAERLAAIEAALREEEAKGLQQTSFYRELENQRVEVIRQGAQEQAKLEAELGREAAQQAESMGQLRVAAEQEHQALMNSDRRVTDAQRAVQEEAAENADYALKAQAYAAELAALDAHGKDFEAKQQAILNKQEQLTQQHENRITQIRDQAEMAETKRFWRPRTASTPRLLRGLPRYSWATKPLPR